MQPHSLRGAVAIVPHQRSGDWNRVNFEEIINIKRYYRRYIDKSADSKGLEFWLTVHEQGMDLETIEDCFIATAAAL